MPIERTPREPLPSDEVPPQGVPYRVRDGDTWESIAAAHGLRGAVGLIEFNFRTHSPAEVNYYLRTNVGCVRTSADGKNWIFSSDASPGRIHLPPERAHRAAGTGEYVVQEGESFEDVAYRHGHVRETLWDHGGNAELKQAREKPSEVLPGDRLHIPAPEPKETPCPTERRHRFRRRGRPASRGILEVHLDLDEGTVAHSQDAFTLTGNGGSESYRATRNLKDDADPRDHGVTLLFAALPKDARYTLKATLQDGSEATLFEDVPFADLHRQSDDLVPRAVPPA